MREHLPCRNILVAVDRGTEQLPVLHRDSELAKELGATLSLAHAVPGAETQPYDTGGDEFALFLLDAARKDMVKLQAETGIAAEASAVLAGGVGKVVRQAALDRHALILSSSAAASCTADLRAAADPGHYDIIRLSPCHCLEPW